LTECLSDISDLTAESRQHPTSIAIRLNNHSRLLVMHAGKQAIATRTSRDFFDRARALRHFFFVADCDEFLAVSAPLETIARGPKHSEHHCGVSIAS
jgi:hypothetical protein